MRCIDITGKRFGQLVVLEEIPGGKGRTRMARCICDCGKETTKPKSHVAGGFVISCGCRHFKHGEARGGKGSPEYNAWKAMIERCQNPANKDFHHYGGRGITVCPEWADIAKFIEDMGRRPKGTSIDRVDGSKGYFKGNCRWADKYQQARNKRNNFMVEYQGKMISICDLAEQIGVTRQLLYKRIHDRGWSVEKAISTPALSNGGKSRCGIAGVHYGHHNDKWLARPTINGRKVRVAGEYDTPQEAAEAIRKYLENLAVQE